MRPNQYWLLPGLLLTQTFFLGTTFGTTVVAVCLFVILGGLAYRAAQSGTHRENIEQRKKGLLGRPLSWFLLLLLVALAVAAWRLKTHFGETFNPVAFFVDAFAHTCLVLGLLFLVKRPRVGHPAMLGLGLLVIMLSTASGASSQSPTSQVTVAVIACIAFLFASRYVLRAWHHEQRMMRITALGETEIATSRSVRSIASANQGIDAQSHEDRQRIGWLFAAVTLSVFLMATSVVASVTNTVLPDVQRIIYDQLKTSFDATAQDINIGNSHYVRGNRLGSLRRHMIVNPNEIALRAYADSQPGYLRGSVFDFYRNKCWEEVQNGDRLGDQIIDSFGSRSIESAGQGTSEVVGLSMRKLRRFKFLGSNDSPIATVQIVNDPLKGHLFFSPLATRWLEAQARQIDLSSHGVIEHGINPQAPYIAGVGSNPLPEPMSPQRKAVLTHIDASMKNKISQYAEFICRDQLTARNKAKEIANHFHQEYEYSLQGVPVPPRDDPLLHFLQTKHPAHCELFASSTALMLRSVNVPTRYVTGYVIDEFNKEEDAWVARNRDAHAWVEAYDDVSRTWFPVESTPGRSYQTLSLISDEQRALTDAASDRENEMAEHGTIIGRVFGWIFSNRATDPIALLIRFGQWPVLLLGLTLLWRRLRRGSGDAMSDDDVKSRRMLASVDRKLKRHALRRPPHETLHQFADRLEQQSLADVPSTLASDVLAIYAKWYRDFAEARYQGQMPQPLATN
ncbi:MAG: transglutaminase-like domain-containing protein [Pirellulaceae bacterium]